jgi:accessory colonization factor AcfC
MEEVYGHIPGILYNIVTPLLTGGMAARAWKATPDLDAWITYESWHYALKDQTELVHISDGERILRITPIAAIGISQNRRMVREFVEFLKSDESHKIFQKWGWK